MLWLLTSSVPGEHSVVVPRGYSNNELTRLSSILQLVLPDLFLAINREKNCAICISLFWCLSLVFSGAPFPSSLLSCASASAAWWYTEAQIWG